MTILLAGINIVLALAIIAFSSKGARVGHYFAFFLQREGFLPSAFAAGFCGTFRPIIANLVRNCREDIL
jgi:hypothetical protein